MNKQQRQCELEVLAQQNNWSFDSTVNISAIPTLKEFEFHTGEKRKIESIENLIKTENISIFDVYWKKEFDPLGAVAAMTHKDSFAQNINYQTMFLVELKHLHLPKIHIYPAKSLNLIDQLFDKYFRKADFQNYPEFEKRFTVRSNDKNISTYFDKKLIEVYEKSDDFWTFGKDKILFIYQPNVLISPKDIIIWQDALLKIADIFGGKYL